jgi:CRP/FNR family transcriptional regulator, cyclic AMP receptor protein
MDTSAILGSSGLFDALTEKQLAAVAEEAHTKRFAKGETLFREGDEADSFLILTEGSVKVFVTSDRGHEMVLATIRPPESLGEVSLLDGGPRSASASALEPVTALVFARSTLLGLVERERSVADAILRSAGGLLRRLTGRAADLVFLDLEGRVAKVLVEMAARRGEPRDDGGVALDLGLTQADLAAMVGGSRQSVNHILHQLEDLGYLRVHGREVVIVNEDALRRRGAG